MLTQFYEWNKWEGIMHHCLLGLTLYVLYLFKCHKRDRTLPNILLFTILIGLETLLHHSINTRNQTSASYL